MKVHFLSGNRVYLRPLERADARAMLPWVNNPEVTRTLLIHRPMSLEGEEKFIERLSEDDTTVGLGIVEKTGDRLVGATSLMRIDSRSRQAQFGILIGDSADWGKGFATEATRLIVGYGFATLNLHRVWLHVAAGNAAGIRVYEKVGFRHEGILREALFTEGRYVDLVTMGILRGELVD